jgi:hypothetical protein
MEQDAKIEQLEKEISDERRRLSTDRLDISFGELINLYKNKELVIRPEYQRLYRWSAKQKTALIESILLSIPIPPIFVAEDKDGVWELVDGLQRVSTFISFFGELESNVSNIPYAQSNIDESDIDEENDKPIFVGNKWKLDAGGLIKSLEGFDVDSLPSALKINLKRAVCRVEILRGESSTTMKYELFKRLNSGGSKLTPQEIRNAIYRGINPKLNELIQELSKLEVFERLTNLSDAKKQELYDQELVLRFIAFLNNATNVNDNTENYLNVFMENAVNNASFDYDYYKKLFTEVLSLINSIENPNIFRNNKNLFVPAEFEGITIAVAQNIEKYRDNIDLLIERIEQLKSDEDFKKYSGTASNSKSRIRNRLLRANAIFSA